MAITIEQLDVNNIAKYFLLRSELRTHFGKDYIIDILSNLTYEEKINLGLGYFPYEYTRLQELIEVSRKAIDDAVIGTDVGQYSQESINKFKIEVDIAEESGKYSPLNEIAKATDKLRQDLNTFLQSAVKEENYTIGGIIYGPNRPADSTNWVPGTTVTVVVDDTCTKVYWISPRPLPEEHPDYQDIIHFQGLLIDGQLFTRFPAIKDLNMFEFIEGAYYDFEWFSKYEKFNKTISKYIGKNVPWIESNYITLEENSIMGTSGDAWYGRNSLDGFLPIDMATLQNVFNIVATLVTDKFNASETIVITPQFISDNTNMIISGIPTGLTVDEFLGKLIVQSGMETKIFNSINLKEMRGTEILEETSRLYVKSPDKVNETNFILEFVKDGE